MKITKYPQSCLKIEINNTVLVIDPGNLVTSEDFRNALEGADAILITHEHADHADPELIRRLSVGIKTIVSNKSAQDLLGKDLVNIVVVDGQEFKVKNVSIKAIELPHFQINGKPAPLNTGYLIEGNFFHPGDSFESVLAVDSGAAVIAGPDAINMKLDQRIFNYVEQTKLKNVIPIHNDSSFYHNDTKIVGETLITKLGVNFIDLENGSSVEI